MCAKRKCAIINRCSTKVRRLIYRSGLLIAIEVSMKGSSLDVTFKSFDFNLASSLLGIEFMTATLCVYMQHGVAAA
jgi:hypothetical protein